MYIKSVNHVPGIKCKPCLGKYNYEAVNGVTATH